MENVLTTYARPYDPERPVVCLDEKVVYLLSTPRGELAMSAGQSQSQSQNQNQNQNQNQSEDGSGGHQSSVKVDYEYQREGTLNLFVMVEPQGGYRHVLARAQRKASDYAHALQWLVDQGYPHARQIEVVQDNLNTHGPAALYQTFAPQEARRLLDKLHFTYTPKHASWLNMAEIEISVFERQCLSRRLSSWGQLEQEVAALEAERNAAGAKIIWQFSCEMARVKLQRLYPKLAKAADDT